MPDLSDLDDTIKRRHVKPVPDSGDWMVVDLTDLENYFHDQETYGESVANENLRRMREMRGFSHYRFVDKD